MMKIPLVLLPCLVCVLGESKLVEWFTMVKSHQVTANSETSSYFHEWLNFKNTHGKVYGDMETEQKRYKAFKSNLQYIEEHNKLFVQGQKSYSLGANAYADMTLEEFHKYMNLNRLMEHSSVGSSTYLPPSNVHIPDIVDWRTKGCVTPIKNQGQCGSCWSFSATGSLEGQHYMKTRNLISLSEQQLIDCSGSFGNYGCNGGFMDYAFEYIEKKGSESEWSYRYRAKQYSCEYKALEVVANCTGHVDVTRSSEADLKTAVATVGPVSVAIDASHRSFQFYKEGVYDEKKCNSTRLNHAVLAVGYGTDGDDDYWLVKNSWGMQWGKEGYINMSRNKNNQCGIATEASYPLV